jgi:serine palmitoyltransferase
MPNQKKAHVGVDKIGNDYVPKLYMKSKGGSTLTDPNSQETVHWKNRASMERFEEPPLLIAICTYFSFILLNLIGRLRDLLRIMGFDCNHIVTEPEKTRDFVPLYQDYEAFYTRNLYRRVRDCWNRPICSAPGAEFDVMDRVSPDNGWTFQYPGTVTRCLNFGSYNYLGFVNSRYSSSNAFDERIARSNETSIRIQGISVGFSPRQESLGCSHLQNQVEQMIADFTGQEAAVVFPMGFATNSLNLPTIVDKHCCVISDQLNHTSLILGIRLSGALIRTFRHNDIQHLEEQLRDAVIYGHPRTRRPFNKILIVVEGIYSMEGSIVRLPEIVALKKRYKAYLYLDEAHSIGALGKTGRGVVEYYGVNPHDIDLAMGTFTKSFGSAGGYISGRREIVDWIRVHSHATAYGSSMSPIVCQQILSVLSSLFDNTLQGEGQRRIRQLAWNTRYFRNALYRMGFIVYGHADSPVVPVILFLPGKVPCLSRECLKRGLGIVVVGFPATPLILSRTRFCISAGHTKEMLDKTLNILEELADQLELRYSCLPSPSWVKEDFGASPSEAFEKAL